MSNITLSPHIIFDKDSKFIENFINEQEYYHLLNIFSLKGFGKTTFLETLSTFYQRRNPLSFVRILDCYDTNLTDQNNLYKLLEAIFEQLHSKYINIASSKIALFDNQLSSEQISNNIIQLINILSHGNRTTLILIDDYDRLPKYIRKEFENIFLSHVISEGRKIKIIISSVKEISFKERRNLRSRLKTHSLNGLNEGDIANIINKPIVSPQTIIKWSGGIPEITTYIIKKMNEKTSRNETISRISYNEIIDQNYRSNINRVLLPESPILSNEVIDVLSLLRRFDVAILSEILPKIVPEKYSSFHPKDYFDLIQEIEDLVYWRSQGGYALHNILRGMLNSYIKIFESDLNKKVNHIVVVVYDSWLSKNFRVHYLTEMLFHQIQLEKINNSSDEKIKLIVSEKIMSHIKGNESISPFQFSNLDEIRNALNDDSDISPYINQEVFDALYSMLC